MKRITGRGPKDKGRAFENEVRAHILANMPPLSAYDITPRSMGDPGVDLILSKVARDLFPYACELKRAERLSIYAAIDQAEAHAKKEKLHPCVIFRKNRGRTYACIPFDSLLWLLSIRNEVCKDEQQSINF